jgi:hypothetical protein
MKKRKTPPRPAKKKTAATRPKTNKPVLIRTEEPKPAVSSGEPEVRRAIPLDYVTTDEVDLRSALAEEEAIRRAPKPPAPLAPSEALAHSELRAKMAKSIVDFEARRDAQGHLRVYNLPASDGGGHYEVAGINERYHPQEAAKLRDLINASRYDEAEAYAAKVIAEYTDVVSKWTTVPGIEAYLRDCAFNRGPGGAAKVLQMALGVKVDGGVGPETLSALRKAEKDPGKLLAALRVAREQYEIRIAGRREKFWRGLVNRWDNSLDFARNVA